MPGGLEFSFDKEIVSSEITTKKSEGEPLSSNTLGEAVLGELVLGEQSKKSVEKTQESLNDTISD